MDDNDAGQPVLDVYARLSFAPGGDTINVDDQVQWCGAEILERGATVGTVFKDNSLSAWKPGVVRPEWNELMARLEAGESDGVMVLDLTRFSRKVMEGERLLELAGQGVLVWSLSSTYDLTTADGRRHFRNDMVTAAGESDKISERTKRGMERRLRKGRRHGAHRGYAMPGWMPIPQGWEPGDPRERVPDEQVAAEREVIRECYRRVLAGEAVNSVLRDLNARKIPTADDGRWQSHTLTRTLRRPTMAGLLAHRGTIVGELADIEPVVAREEWERLCALFDARKSGRPAGRQHLLSSLIRCGTCGMKMSGTRRSGSPLYADGTPKREYKCIRDANRPDHCGRNGIDGKTADEAVAEAVKALLGDPRHADQVAKRLAQTSKQREKLETEVRGLNESADNLAEKTAAWGMARVDKAMAPILDRLEQLTLELAGLDSPMAPGTAAADVASTWDRAAARGDLEKLRSMIKRAFPYLVLAPAARWGDHSATRFDWDGTSLPQVQDRRTTRERSR